MSDPISSLVSALGAISSLVGMGTSTISQGVYVRQALQPTPAAQVQRYQRCPPQAQPIIVQNPDGSYRIECQQRQP